MSKNNQLKNATPERRNYKLYKAKKQWITACATFLLTFGATAVMNVSAQADQNAGSAEPVVEEKVANSTAPTGSAVIANADSATLNSSVVASTAPKETPASASAVEVHTAPTDQKAASVQPSKASATSNSEQTAVKPAKAATPAQNIDQTKKQETAPTSAQSQQPASTAGTQSTASEQSAVAKPATPAKSTVAPTAGDNSAKTTLDVTKDKSDATSKTSATEIGVSAAKKDGSNTDSQTVETEIRTATVNYVNAKNGQSMGNAQLQIFYKRTVTTDSTGKKTYGNWQWDKSQGDSTTPGYRVISGNWTLPQEWTEEDNNGIVEVATPDVTGFTKFTKGDWEKNKDGSTSNIDANKFTFPTYGGTSTTITGANSVAFTADAPVYEATATHTVYYAPVQTEEKTITEHYKKYDEATGQYVDADVVNMPDGTKQAFAQVNVWYQQTATGFATNGSTDPKNWTITYGGWSWDRSAGDPATPGVTVLSGGYRYNGQKVGQGLWEIPTTTLWGIDTPTLNGYTAVKMREDSVNSSDVFGNPATAQQFNNPLNGSWYYRDSLTTFYVPNDMLSKTITRTINITNPITGKSSIPQTVTYSRQPYLNKGSNTPADPGDTRVIFKDWTANYNIADWAAYTPTAIPGYNTFIDGKKGTTVPKVPVAVDTKDTTVNVTYASNTQIVEINFVDDDENQKVVSTVTESGNAGQTTNFTLTVPTKYELATGQTLPTSYTFNDGNNTPITIHLKHKTEDVSDTDPQAKETRQIAVNYVNAATGQSMGDLAPASQMDVYYKRSATKDLVTGDVTYGNWQWDTNRDRGYHIVHGSWTTPASNVNFYAITPNVAGYTAIESGDWEKNSDGSRFTAANATRFCSPDWSGNTAYLSTNYWYDTTPIHTVYFVPDKVIAKRTLTVNYKYWENGQAGSDAFAPAHVTVNYTNHATNFATNFATNGKTDHT
ncbi:mucin-binding protein [Limosilactobacillus sp.]|uniref:mucin-binding protein n=1 Tax=Limosilactobacillus sp. TaxID=2773925 RepID=UPI003F097EBC